MSQQDLRMLFVSYRVPRVLGIALAATAGAVLLIAFGFFDSAPTVSASEEGPFSDPITRALYDRTEFFGTEALVPFAPDTAKANLLSLYEKDPSNFQALEKVAEIEEQNDAFEAAEAIWNELTDADRTYYDGYGEFLKRRGRFEEQAKLLQRLFVEETDPGSRPARLGDLLDAAGRHGFSRYLTREFFESHRSDLTGDFATFERFLTGISEHGEKAAALELARTGKKIFESRELDLTMFEISVLRAVGRDEEAEEIYVAAFDPLWSDSQTRDFYEFLSGRDRLLEYGTELKKRFREDPSDFGTAVRFAHFRKYRYEPSAPVIAELEKRKRSWTGDELLTAARLLLSDGEGDMASRFLYTLLNRKDTENDRGLRARVIYQLFEIFSDAASSRLALSAGGLGSYAELAKIDTDPGISSGVLSLIFSDTDPGGEFEKKLDRADELFNRAAAYRLFSIYKQEFGTTPEMAQMYLDLVRLYSVAGGEKVAYELLGEFEQRHEITSDYPAVAMRLAAAFESREDYEHAAEIYQRVLDRTGDRGDLQTADGTLPESGFPGITIPKKFKDEENDRSYDYSPSSKFKDSLQQQSDIPYWYALERLVELLKRRGETARILKLYSDEIRKYPDREWLYEQRLDWLEGTNLTDEKAEVYNSAVSRFKMHKWRDKFARFLLRQGRERELKRFGESISESLGDAKLAALLSDIASSGAGEAEFRKAILEKLYLSALERYPSNTGFATGLLALYSEKKDERKWLDLAAAYFFISDSIRSQFMDRIAAKQELKAYQERAEGDSDVYRLFRAEANARLSRFEESYRGFADLAKRYPGHTEFQTRTLSLARSLGQTSRSDLETAAVIAERLAKKDLSQAEWLIVSGEIAAELGDFERAGANWEPVISSSRGNSETYLEVATIYWDYFQFDKARKTIDRLRQKTGDPLQYAYEAGAILENEGRTEEAIREYINSLSGTAGQGDQREKTVRRLSVLARRDPALARSINSEYLQKRRKLERPGHLVLGYASVLSRAGLRSESEALFGTELRKTRDKIFLKDALDFFYWEENEAGRQAAYRRLIEIEGNPRALMDHHLRLAESLRESRKLSESKDVIRSLAARFPSNYGVITESSRFLVYIGEGPEAVKVLRRGLLRARGKYRLKLARMLAKTQVDLGRLDEASELLSRLHTDFDYDPDIFRALATVLVKQNRPAALRTAFDKTLASLNSGNRERIYVRQRSYELRKEMVEAFTILNDPVSAIDQYIEIINRNPRETGDLVDMAISYAKRYGVTGRLTKYYERLSDDSFKNHRWNLVLASLYEAEGELSKAADQLNKAIASSPGDAEMHIRLSVVELRRGRYAESLRAIDRVIELTGEDTENLKTRLSVLEKMGRSVEASALREKLAGNTGDASGFDAASRTSDAAEALELYRKAFEDLLADPIKTKLDRSDLTLYARCIRDADSLTKANSDLWGLREKYVAIAESAGSTEAGAARERIRLVDSVIGSVIGGIARERADNEELRSLYDFLLAKLGERPSVVDKYSTLALVEDLGKQAGFGVLEEKILRNKAGNSVDAKDRRAAILALGQFYESRGSFKKMADAYRDLGLDDLSSLAYAARLSGDSGSELRHLESIYFNGSGAPNGSTSPEVARFLDILYERDKKSLARITRRSSKYQIQTINFLLANGERKLVHSAIESAEMPKAWKLSRHAEASLALGETGKNAECYFCYALNLDSIGKMIEVEPEKSSFLVNDDWFRLARKYGEWLEKADDPVSSPELLLPASVENRPSDASAHYELGVHYLSRGKTMIAIRHFRPSTELAPDNQKYAATLGAALRRIGEREAASRIFHKLDTDREVDSAAAYVAALSMAGLTEEARSESARLIELHTSLDRSAGEGLARLVRETASIYESEQEKARAFERITDAIEAPAVVIQLILNDSLVSDAFRPALLQRLVDVSERGSDNDHWFVSTTSNLRVSGPEAESIYDQQIGYEEVSEPTTDRYVAQRQLFELQKRLGRYEDAQRTAENIAADLRGRYARPSWLRLGQIELEIATGRFDPASAGLFIGIDDSNSAFSQVKAPDIERLNSVLRLLNKGGMATEAARLESAFFARMLALGNYNIENLAGLARALFKLRKDTEALALLNVTASLFDPQSTAESLRLLDELPSVKGRLPLNRSQSAFPETGVSQMIAALGASASVAGEAGHLKDAIKFRRRIAELNPADSVNREALASLLSETGEQAEAVKIWNELADDRFALRPVRWTSVAMLLRAGSRPEWTEEEYDAYSLQLAASVAFAKGDRLSAIEKYSAALLADPGSQEGSKRRLTVLYAESGFNAAALRLADSLTHPCEAELCRKLSVAAESEREFEKAIRYEQQSGAQDADRIARLRTAARRKEKKFTAFTVDLKMVSRQ